MEKNLSIKEKLTFLFTVNSPILFCMYIFYTHYSVRVRGRVYNSGKIFKHRLQFINAFQTDFFTFTSCSFPSLSIANLSDASHYSNSFILRRANNLFEKPDLKPYLQKIYNTLGVENIWMTLRQEFRNSSFD